VTALPFRDWRRLCSVEAQQRGNFDRVLTAQVVGAETPGDTSCAVRHTGWPRRPARPRTKADQHLETPVRWLKSQNSQIAFASSE
jgi:hypothetical protein